MTRDEEPDHRWIVFDYGEVISGRTTALPRLASTLGVSLADFEPPYWSLRERYDQGISDLEYWSGVGEALGVSVDKSTSDTLTRLDVEGWSHVEPASLALIESLAEAGASLALLSNAPSSFARFAERQPWTRHFRVLVFSGDEGVVKPHREIFERLLARLDARAADCLFLDDRQSNVDGARAVGLRAHRWQGADAARALL